MLDFRLLTKIEIKVLLFTFIFYSIYTFYHVFTFVPFVDEILTFLDYSSKGFFKSISTYEEPNNHVFFSILTNFTYSLPLDSLINLRIVNVLIGMVGFAVSYFIIRKHFSISTSLIVHTGFVFSYFYTYYSVFARGYMLHIFFVILSFYLIEKLTKQKKIKHSIFFVIITSLGFFTIPTYLYFAFSLFLYILIINRKNHKVILFWLLLFVFSAIFTLIFYTPILINEGLSAITNNKWTTKLEYVEILLYFKSKIFNMYDNILGVNSAYIYVIYFISLLLLFYLVKSSRRTILFIFMLFLTPIFMMWILKMIPGPRVWSYLTFPFYLGLGFIVEYLMKLFTIKTQNLIIVLVFLVISLNVTIFNKNIKTYALQLDYESKKIADYCLNKKYKSVQVYGPYKSYEELFLKFQYRRNSKRINIVKVRGIQGDNLPVIISNSYLNNFSNYLGKKIEYRTPHILILR
jgi:hypothetical protein